jgi:predicted DNA-binding ArsR family transcriptional regulator
MSEPDMVVSANKIDFTDSFDISMLRTPNRYLIEETKTEDITRKDPVTKVQKQNTETYTDVRVNFDLLEQDLHKIFAIVDTGIEEYLLKDYSQTIARDRFSLTRLSKKQAKKKSESIRLGQTSQMDNR